MNNRGTSAASATFGTDYTAPSIRQGLAEAASALVVVTSADTTYAASKPVAGVGIFRAEFLDDRAGFSTTAQKHALSSAGHVFNAGTCVVGTGTPGASFVTAPTCGLSTATFGVLRIDGWQSGQQVNIPAADGYYGYTTTVTDAAGNVSATLFRKELVSAVSPFATGLSVPGLVTNAGFNASGIAADSTEIVAASLQLEYPVFAGLAGGVTDSVRYSRTSVGTVFDNVITSPIVGNSLNPNTGAPYVRGIETVNANAFPTNNIQAAPPATTKPTSILVWSWNPGGLTGAAPAPGRSVLVGLPALIVQNGVSFNTFNTGNVTNSVTHFRIIPSVAAVDWFGSSVPLRAQAVSPTNTPNAPFARVDFYRWNGTTHWDYLGSSASAIGSDQGTYRSWIYALPNASFLNAWNGSAVQGVLASGNIIAAVGVTAAGDGLAAGLLMP